MQELASNSNRRFVYVELAYFWRWWNQQNNNTKQLVRTFVNERRLEFVIGGWCMNDEATPYYIDMIDQETLGLQFILKEFGECARPKVAWQLDPFGHSREQASLLAQFGFDGLFLGRLDYQDDQHRINTQTREFIWWSSNNLGDTVNLFTGFLVQGNLYSPPPGFCWDNSCDDDPIMDDPTLEDYNVDIKVNNFLTFIQEKLGDYKTKNLMLTMGSDFQYSNAHMWYKNLDKLIYYVNQRSNETNVNIFYSTPSCYLYSLYKANLTWSVKRDDFFPYAHKPHAFWTGYFTSRTTLKDYVRRTSNYLQAVRQLSAYAQLNENVNSEMLGILERVMGVVQHHDAVSGTERQHVARDYAKRLAIGTEQSRIVISNAYARLLKSNYNFDQQYCPLLNISECLPIAYKDKFTMIVYNPLARTQISRIRLPVSDTTYVVRDANTGIVIPVDILEVYNETKKIPERVATTNFELVLPVELPPLGFRVFNISNSNSKKLALENKFLKPNDNFVLKNMYLQVTFDSKGNLQSITSLNSSLNTSLNSSLTHQFCYYDSFVGLNHLPDEQSSGAYIFRPKSQEPTCLNVADFTMSYKSYVQEVHQIYNDWLSQTIRLYDDAQHVEIEWQVGPIPIELIAGKEVITRFSSDLMSNNTFYTDSNGREILRRIRNYRPTWTLNQTEPVSGNYYPINSKIYIKDELPNPAGVNRQLSILTDRTHGGSSINDGQIEIMLHRRLLWDDSLGVLEPLDELGINLKGLIAKGKIYLLFNSTVDSPRLHRDLSHKINSQPLITFPDADEESALLFSKLNKYQVITQSLPDNIELITFKRDFNADDSQSNAIIVRFEHFYEINEDYLLSQPVTIDIAQLFGSTFNIVSINELALGENMDVSELESRLKFSYLPQNDQKPNSNCKFETLKTSNTSSYPVTLNPMQIRTFRIRYIPS